MRHNKIPLFLLGLAAALFGCLLGWGFLRRLLSCLFRRSSFGLWRGRLNRNALLRFCLDRRRFLLFSGQLRSGKALSVESDLGNTHCGVMLAMSQDLLV